MDHLFKVHDRGLPGPKARFRHMNATNVNELFNQLVCLFIIPVSTGRTGASARSVRGDLLRGIGSSTTA